MGSISEASSTASHKLNQMLVYCGLALYCLMILIVGLQMVTRWVLGPWLNIFWVWTGDLSEYLLVFLTFIGAGIVSREHEHISIDFIVERVSQSAARILLGIQISFIMIFLLILAQGIIPLYLRNQGLQIGTLPVQPPFTSAWLYIAAGAGALIMLAYAIRDAVYLITNPENILPHTNDEENG